MEWGSLLSEDLEIPKGNHFLFMRFQLFPEVFTEVTLTPVMTTQSNISRQITMKSLFCHQTFPLTSRLKIVALSWAGSTAGQFVAEMGTFLEDVTQQQGQIFHCIARAFHARQLLQHLPLPSLFCRLRTCSQHFECLKHLRDRRQVLLG